MKVTAASICRVKDGGSRFFHNTLPVYQPAQCPPQMVTVCTLRHFGFPLLNVSGNLQTKTPNYSCRS